MTMPGHIRKVCRNLDEGTWASSGHRIVRTRIGKRVRAVTGRTGNLAYEVTTESCRHCLYVPGGAPEVTSIDCDASVGNVLSILEGPSASRADGEAAEAIRDFLGAEGTRIADRCLGDWFPRDAARLGGAGGADVEAEILHALPTDHLRSRHERFDPVSWARGLCLPWRGEPSPGRIRRLLATPDVTSPLAFGILLSLPEDWTPRNAGEWTGLESIAMTIGDEFRPYGWSSYAPLAVLLGSYDFLRAGRGRWAELAERLPGNGGEGGNGIARDIFDMAMSFAHQLVVPLLHRHGLCDDLYPVSRVTPATAIAARILFGSKGLPAIMEMSMEWHARGFVPGTGDIVLADSMGEVGWPVPIGRTESPEKIRFVALGWPAELRAEGRAMQHCVGGYAPLCASGKSVILSVRDPYGVRLSTLELAPLGGGRNGFKVVQHRGFANAIPVPEAVQATAWLMGILGTPAMPVPDAYLEHRWKTRDGVERPYDAMDDEALARMVDAWSPYLPRPLRTPGALGRAAVGAAIELLDTHYLPDRFGGLDGDGGLTTWSLDWDRGDRKARIHLPGSMQASYRRMLRNILPLRARCQVASALAWAPVVVVPAVGILLVSLVLPFGWIPLDAYGRAAVFAGLIALPLAALWAASTSVGHRIRMKRWRRRAKAALKGTREDSATERTATAA